LARPAEIAAAVGVRRENGQPLYAVPSFFLGTNEVSPLAMAGAYAAFAAHGLACATYGVTSVADSSGKQLSSGQPACRQAIAAPIADRVTAILQGVIDGPDPRRTGIKASIGRPAAGKTGTTENFSAAWFDGYTPQLAAAVWVGDPRGGFAHPLQNVTVASQFFTHVYGGDLPAEIWQRTMSAALAGTPVTPFHLSASAAPAVPPRRGQPAPASPVQATPPTGVPNRPPPPSPSRHHRHHHGGPAGG
jgi:membrane peptidoglycan carboxypeptidase